MEKVSVGGQEYTLPDAKSEPSFWDKVMYGWDATVIPTQHIMRLYEQQTNEDPDVVRATQKVDLDKYLSEQYPDIHNTPNARSAVATAAGFFKNLVDPATIPLYLVPFTTPLKGAAIGGGMSAGLMSLKNIAEDGEPDPASVGAALALGVGFGSIGGALGRSARNAKERDIASLGYAMTQRYKEYRDKWHVSPARAYQNTADDFMTDITGVTRARDVARQRIESELDSSVKTYAKMLKKGADPINAPNRFVRERASIESRIHKYAADNNITDDAARAAIGDKLETRVKQGLLHGDTNPFLPDAKTPTWVGRYLGIVSDQLGRIHPALAFKLRRTEQQVLDATHNFRDKLTVGEKLWAKTPTAIQDQIKVALRNGDDALVKQLASPELYTQIQHVRGNVFSPLADMADEVGHKFTLLKDYWPTHYSDFEGFALKNRLSTRWRGRAQEDLIDLYQRMKGMTATEAQQAFKSFMTRPDITPLSVGPPSNLLERKIKKLDISDAKYLTDPFKAARIYVHDIVDNYFKRKFFGYSKKTHPNHVFNLEESVNGLLHNEVMNKSIRLNDVDTIRKLFLARFGPGEQTPGKWNQRIKNVIYGATLGDPTSAATQLGDIGTSFAFNGVVNTLRAIFGKRFRMEDVGLRKLYEELSSTTRTAKWLDRVLSASGFNAIDKFGKSVYLTAALRRLQKQVQSPRGMAKFVSKYQPMFDSNELAIVLRDLRSTSYGRASSLNPNTRAVLFSELADVQPIVRSEMPAAYLANPNGRMMYMLKTFVIRQMNAILNKTVYNSSGAEGTKNAVRVGMLLMGTGAGIDSVKQAARGKEVTFSDATVGAMLRSFALSQYIANQLISQSQKTGKINIDVQRAAGLLFVPPPAGIAGEGLESVLSWFSDDPNAKVLRNVPFGRFVHDFVLGLGQEK